MRLVKIGLASVNATVGAVKSNLERCLGALAEMEEAGVTIACLPEQVLGGYPSEDLVQWRGFVEAQWDALQVIAARTAGHPSTSKRISPSDSSAFCVIATNSPAASF